MDTTTCITNTVWEQYANQQLSAAQQLALQQHVDGCDLCTDIKSGIDFMQNPAMLTTHVAKINTTVDASLGAKLVKLNPWYIAVAATLLAVLGLTLLYKQDVPNAQIAQENKAQHLGVIIDSVKPAEIKLPTPKSLALATTKKANKPSVAVSSTQPILPPEVITMIASDEHQIESDKNLVEVAKSEEKVTLAIDASEKVNPPSHFMTRGLPLTLLSSGNTETAKVKRAVDNIAGGRVNLGMMFQDKDSTDALNDAGDFRNYKEVNKCPKTLIPTTSSVR
jgi:hypothetical protein